jgi:hypothetical protein
MLVAPLFTSKTTNLIVLLTLLSFLHYFIEGFLRDFLFACDRSSSGLFGRLSMEKFLIALILVFSTVISHAATEGDNEINCDFIAASSTNAYETINGTNTKTAKPVNESGKVKLTKEGKSYTGSFTVAADFQVAVEALFSSPSEFNVNVKVIQNSNQTQTNLASAGAYFAPDNSGNFVGKVIVRSSALENIAIKNEVAVQVAPVDQLSIGNNFLGALVTCK